MIRFTFSHCFLLAEMEPFNCIKFVATVLHTEERLRAVQDRCWAVCWHHSGALLASCGEDRTVKVWRCADVEVAAWTKTMGGDDDQNMDNNSSSAMYPTAAGHDDNDGQDDDDVGFADVGGGRTTSSSTTTSLELLCTMRGDQSRSIRSVAFSPCGRLLASASFDASIVVYEKQQHNADGGGAGVEFEELHRLEGHENEVKCVAFSASGEHLATCSRDKSVWVWQLDDAGDFQVTSILQHHTADVKFVLWHPRAELLVSGGYDGSIRFYAYDGEDWYTAQAIKDAHEETVWSAAFEPTMGDHLATVGTDRTVRIWTKKKHCLSSSTATDENEEEEGQGQWHKVVDHSLQLNTRWPLYTAALAATTSPAAAGNGILAIGGGDCLVRLFSVDLELCALALLTALRMDSEVNCVSWRPITARCKTDQQQQQLAVALDSGHIHLLYIASPSN